MQLWHFDPDTGALTGASRLEIDEHLVIAAQQDAFNARFLPAIDEFKRSDQGPKAQSKLIQALDLAHNVALRTLPGGMPLPPHSTLLVPPLASAGWRAVFRDDRWRLELDPCAHGAAPKEPPSNSRTPFASDAIAHEAKGPEL
jgi:hypothetical protein